MFIFHFIIVIVYLVFLPLDWEKPWLPSLESSSQYLWEIKKKKKKSKRSNQIAIREFASEGEWRVWVRGHTWAQLPGRGMGSRTPRGKVLSQKTPPPPRALLPSGSGRPGGSWSALAPPLPSPRSCQAARVLSAALAVAMGSRTWRKCSCRETVRRKVWLDEMDGVWREPSENGAGG